MSFHKQSFLKRLERMGDESETIFERWAKSHGINVVRLGLNRPPFKFFQSLPASIRYIPDYIVEDSDRKVRDSGGPMDYVHSFVEVKGVGKDQLVKIKLETLRENERLSDHFKRPVIYFIWDKISRKVSFHHNTKDIYRIVADNEIPVKAFHEGNQYYGIPTELLGWISKPIPSSYLEREDVNTNES